MYSRVNGAGFRDCHCFRTSFACLTARQPEGCTATVRYPQLNLLRGFAVCLIRKGRFAAPPLGIISITQVKHFVKHFQEKVYCHFIQGFAFDFVQSAQHSKFAPAAIVDGAANKKSRASPTPLYALPQAPYHLADSPYHLRICLILYDSTYPSIMYIHTLPLASSQYTSSPIQKGTSASMSQAVDGISATMNIISIIHNKAISKILLFSFIIMRVPLTHI